MPRSISSLQTQYFALLFAGLTSALFLLYKYAFRPGLPDPASTKLLKELSNPDDDDDDDDNLKNGNKNSFDNATPLTSNKGGTHNSNSSSGTTSSASDDDETESEDMIAQLHAQIEEIDKRGKVLFKKKNYLEAADVFSEAVDLINSKVKDVAKNINLNRQVVTLMNNRSAMYEKGAMPDLALIGKMTVEVIVFCLIVFRVLRVIANYSWGFRMR